MIRVPTIHADDFVLRFERCFINLDSFHRARRGTHSIFHMRAFERGTCRRGCANQSFAIAENQFSIRANIDQQPVLILLVRFFGKDHRARIRTDKGCDRRQHMDIPRRVDLQSQLARFDIH